MWRRLSAGHLLMGLAGALALLANLAVLRSLDQGMPVVVAARQLPAGHVLTAGDLTTRSVDGDSELLAALVPGDRLEELVGQVLTHQVAAGDPLRGSDVLPAAASGLRAMSIPVEPAHAAGGALSVGDRVDVIAVADGVARYVLDHAEVLQVAPTQSAGLGGSAGFYVVVAVDGDEALQLAVAIREQALEVVKSTGSDRVEGG